MTEKSQCWHPARKALAPYGTLVRVENRLEAGFPDVLYCLLGVSGLVECKVDLGSLSLDQVIWAERWGRAGGLCWLLWRHPAGWALFDHIGVRSVHRGTSPREVAELWTQSRSFPTTEALERLAPRRLRYPAA